MLNRQRFLSAAPRQGANNGAPLVRPTPARISSLQPTPGAVTARRVRSGSRRSKGRLHAGATYTVSSEAFDPFAEAERRIAERMRKEEENGSEK